jgi:hypothetical protein
MWPLVLPFEAIKFVVILLKIVAPTSQKTQRLHYNGQLINVAKENNGCLLWESYGIHNLLKKRQILLLEMVEHAVFPRCIERYKSTQLKR